MQCFLRFAGFLGAAAGTEERQKSGEVVVTTIAATTTTLATTAGIPVMDVTRETGVSSPTDLPILVANAAHNYEILHERDDDDAEQKSGDRHQPTSKQSSHRNHCHNNDCHGSDRRGFQQSRGSFEGYSYLVCTTCGRRHPGECRRAAGTCFKYSQAGHLQKDCKKNTTARYNGLLYEEGRYNYGIRARFRNCRL
nr:hypothetical protein [Tanacetum cinerariifolium]